MADRRARSTGLVTVAIAVVALLGVVGYRSSALSSSSSTSASTVPTTTAPPAPPPTAGVADGVVPAGVTVFDDRYPAVTRLDPALLRSVRRAATAAAGDGIAFALDSGWRSRRYQEQLLREAVAKYGSEREAARWVATPDTSAHVSGDAVDIGPPAAAAWLSAHGARYGLCRIYGNEAWHFELRPSAVDHGCPPRYADPTQDPRMQR
jgi:zinc D-Ala-D-Ala carboxypeptidase